MVDHLLQCTLLNVRVILIISENTASSLSPKCPYLGVPWWRRHLEDVLPGEFHAVLAPVHVHLALRVELARLGDVGHQLLDVARAHVLAHHNHGPGRKGVEWLATNVAVFT